MLDVNVADVLTVQIKDIGLVCVKTEKWSPEFVLQLVQYACRVKIDQAKNKDKDATQAKRAEEIAKAVAQLESGEWTQRASVAASLDDEERELRALLAKEFFKVHGKKTQAEADARLANRWEVFRDVVLKKKIQEVATDAAELQELMGKLEQRLVSARHTLEARARNNAEDIRKMREEISY